jgi:hypothetical protein
MGCQICGSDKTTVFAEFSGNIGAIVMRFLEIHRYELLSRVVGSHLVLRHSALSRHKHHRLLQVPAQFQESRRQRAAAYDTVCLIGVVREGAATS